MVKKDPTTLYIYPEADDIKAVVKYQKKSGKRLAQAKPYWNKSCLKQIKTPKYWSKDQLEPLLERYKKAYPAAAPRPVPLCKS
jgi:hypothetical protein